MRNLLISLGSTRLFSFIGLVALLIAIPLTVSVSLQQQTIEQQASGPVADVNTFIVSGKVFIDSNRNSSQELSETGYANITVLLTYADNSEDSQSAKTDANGNFIFPKVTKGNVTVGITLPPGYESTNQTSTTLLAPVDTQVTFAIAERS